jgi:hypothetical protein
MTLSDTVLHDTLINATFGEPGLAKTLTDMTLFTHRPMKILDEREVVVSTEVSTEQHAKLNSFFVLSIISASSGKLVATAFLTCGPPSGTHPYPDAACKQLSKVNGEIDKIPEDPGPCPQIFDPVILVAIGAWNGEPRSYQSEFPNRCVGVRSTGGVIFNF